MRTKEAANLGTSTPWIVFDYLCIDRWVRDGITVAQLYDQTEKLRERVKKATGYQWDNSHFYVTDIFGVVRMQISFYKDSISLWDADGNWLKTITAIDDDVREWWNEALASLANGKHLCNECEEWFKKGHRYSFAGFVCNRCYDPKRHMPPDTRGD